MQRLKPFLFSVLTMIAALLAALVIAEFALRLKNSDGKNYHIEMWKYSRLLKARSENAILGHEHIPDSSARLQNVDIRINSRGMRGAEFERQGAERRILLIGSSATLGWGVPEDDTMSARLQQKFDEVGQRAIVMNAGIGNYNAVRYVELFLSKNKDIEPTDIVINYYLNDAEVLEGGGGNPLTRNSELAVTFWILINRLNARFGAAPTLLEHYRTIYDQKHEGFTSMKESLRRLSEYANSNNVNLYLMMMPEVHDLRDYKYQFAHEIMRQIAGEFGYKYIDSLPSLKNVDDTKALWAMPGDPHPNGLAHRMFAELLFDAFAPVGSD